MTESARRLQQAARRLGAHETGRRLSAAGLRGLGVSLAVLAALVALARFVPLDREAPRLLLGAVALAFVAALLLPWAFLARAWRRRRAAMRDPEEAARRTEAQAAALRQRLVPALQVLRIRDERRTAYSGDLVDAFVEDTVADVEAVRPATLPYNAGFRRAGQWAGAGHLLLALVALMSGPRAAWHGFVDVASAAGRLGPRPRPEFHVRPGDTSVPRGSSVQLAVDVSHAVLSRGEARGTLEWRAANEDAWHEVTLRTEGAAR